jgi:hypothetical protein
MYAHAAWFDDPERTCRIMRPEGDDEVTQTSKNGARSYARPRLQDDNSGALLRGKPQDMAKVVIERYERPPFRQAYREQIIVCGTGETLITNRLNVVSGSPQQLKAALTEILVQLEFHTASTRGIGMMRSRVISAP